MAASIWLAATLLPCTTPGAASRPAAMAPDVTSTTCAPISITSAI